MEDIHGVQVDWLYHSNRDRQHRLNTLTGPDLAKDVPPPPSHTSQNRHIHQNTKAVPAAPQVTPPRPIPVHSNTTPVTSQQPSPNLSKTPPKRPGLPSRSSGERLAPHVSPDPGPKAYQRRSSWISNISSKFSSQSLQQTGTAHTNGAPPPQSGKPSSIGPAKAQVGLSTEEIEPYVPQQPKSGNPGFFSNALRRLSSNTNLGSGKTALNGSICPRRILNVDKNRPRCLLPELDQAKLRRVAFCVDVEIAGGPRYKDEPDAGEKKRKTKEKKLKEKGEAEALKHPHELVQEKEKNGVIEVCDENVGTSENSNPEGTVNEEDKKESSRKKEKKKRSEEERKERKGQKRRKAEENGQIPVQITRDADSSGRSTPAGGVAAPPRPMDRPTTDPLRIYRRCCQLRETPVLKRISDQLQNKVACPVSTPGVVSILDLTGSRLQFADVMTLSDWLAIVPVKRLILEDSDLTDEGIRVILAGLLATRSLDRPVQQSLAFDGELSPPQDERSGVIEKLSLKNNSKMTKEGWKHISLFIYMCKSLRALDVSMNHFPVSRTDLAGEVCRPEQCDPAEIFAKAISERLGGNRFEELIMAECSLTSSTIRKIVDGVTVSGLNRLGLAGNNIDEQGIDHVIHYLRSGVCQGLDLGGNDMRDHMEHIGEAFHTDCPIWALSLADCNLTPASLQPFFPALLRLKNLRFLDLSHNHDLFSKQPGALGLLRKYLPMFPLLKRIHLMDVSMTPAQAIAFAEILPECPWLAHVNLLENPQLSALASATDEEMQEEACALYASLMAAVRVSSSLICVDIDVPTSDNSEVVKALAKQVIAYCLRNMRKAIELGELGEAAVLAATEGQDTEVDVPDVLLHLVGHEDSHVDAIIDEPAPSNDYIVGGTGVVKALSYCLSEKASELRRGSYTTSGNATPSSKAQSDIDAKKAKQMSKDLLDSARKVRSRLQPALVREAKNNDDMAYRRLLFLDNTLQGMIQRFEDEYPECRPTLPVPISKANGPSIDRSDAASTTSSKSGSLANPGSLTSVDPTSMSTSIGSLHGSESASDDEHDEVERPFLSRHNSDVSLAARALTIEEAQVHRMGQKVKRELLSPSGGRADNGWNTSTGEDLGAGQALDENGETEHLKLLRSKLEELQGEELRNCVVERGWEKTAEYAIGKAREGGEIDPEGFRAEKDKVGNGIEKTEKAMGKSGTAKRSMLDVGP
ncbi:RNI-like protein [Venturia nashicola]|uniref:RNI-like protein n=1 Tax=Venturia nashicola TaxID=86259 RepID=A0A4Z1NVC7_9PEZI|nr:RNI-like protein [Venturia nashicola]